jgi:DNA phosphorothioation-associated DGQHR protein 1
MRGDLICKAIRIEQPIGSFFAFTLDAETLNEITYSLPAQVVQRLEHESPERRGGYSIFGSQRAEKKNRLEEIASYIQTTEATFPNAIILAANYDENGRLIEEEQSRWRVGKSADGCWELTIPGTSARSASIIDGQHRLHAFDLLPAGAPERAMELLCVVFLELPTPYHAYIFATINFNQKKVDRSLAYDLFGFDLDERPAKFWSPDTTAVYLARLLNTERGSPLYGSIYPAADSRKVFSANRQSTGLRVSMATIVDGLLRLISKNPKEDRYAIRRSNAETLGRSILMPASDLPLRSLYLAENDRAIYQVVRNYFQVVSEVIWASSGPESYLRKTVGFQALFDVLKIILATRPIDARSFSVDSLSTLLAPARGLDPSGEKYQASGIGRSEIRKELVACLGL